MGTAGYMSPEQVRGEHVDHRADIFAFGVILYEMLSGKRAFHRATSAETMTAILNEEPTAVSQPMPDTPPALMRLVHRCMEKNTERRAQSALDLAYELAEMDGVRARTPRRRQRARSRMRKAKVWMLVGGVMFLVGLVIAGWYLMRPRPTLRVTGYTQITHEGSRKGLIGTDGSRLYLNQWPNLPPIVQVAISGGAMVPVPVALPNPGLLNISPDGSNLLVSSQDGDANSLWSVEMPGGSLRHLADGIIHGAVWSPDAKSVAYSTEHGEIFAYEAMEPRFADLSLNRALVTRLPWPRRQTATRSDSPGTKGCGRSRRTDRDFTNFFRIGAPPPGSAAAAGLPMGDSSYSCQITQLMANSCGLSMSVADNSGMLPRSRVPLTLGPLRWGSPIPSKDGKRIFAQGYILRGELLRYDAQSHQLQPYLGGISAQDVSFSPNGQFIAYVTWPDGILWRANRDGSNPVRLTDPPSTR